MRDSMRGLFFAAMLLGGAVAALAHDTWLLPARSAVQPGARVPLEMTSGMAFPKNETAIAPDRVSEARMRLGGAVRDLGVHKQGRDALALDASPDRSGVATIWVSLKPRTLELTEEQVAHYLEEIGAAADVRRRWEAFTPPRRWRESYRKHSKTFVLVGTPKEDRSWSEPVGLPLELVPGSDPTALRVGDELTVRLLHDGKPAAGVGVGLVHEGSATPNLRTTDDSGRVTFRLEADGRWLLRATDLRPSAQQGLDWESDFATLTVFVRPHTGG